ncbi:porin family protein [Methylobacterium sp. NEAU 140]|uniref:outer membrane protein n=1 Tax=Methylobacterium sp. NEAU 140 TaxID=3064945 RepID=UPI002736C107|nr:porin family protein [Methylobacterium sp. NEAU 140]MDP4026082.1 porin family protein [Methylobacterium sp. NEAU 140]
MSRIVTSLAAFTALTAAAAAADLPRRAPPPVFTPVPVFTWTGAYFGINAGYITTTKDTVFTAGVLPANNGVINGNRPAALPLPQDGFTGGGQIGYNYQLTPGAGVVVGLEADAAYTDLNRSRGFIGTNRGISVFRQSTDYLGTVRGRLGYAFDRTLVYATGGFAYGDVSYRGLYESAAGVPTFYGARTRTETGWTAGGGIEYALPTDSFLNFFKSSAVTVKAEGLYYDLGRRSVVLAGLPGVGVGSYVSRFQNEGVLGRVGLNYKFGSY